MAVLEVSLDEAALVGIVGIKTMLRGRALFHQGAVRQVEAGPGGHEYQGLVADKADLVMAFVHAFDDARGRLAELVGACNCSVGQTCAHQVALVLAGRARARGVEVTAPSAHAAPPAPTPAAWERALAPLLPAEPEQRPGPGSAGRVPPPVVAPQRSEQLALQFELSTGGGRGSAGGTHRVGLRPVVPGRTGWVRSGVSWHTLEYYGYRYGRPQSEGAHVSLLVELYRLAGSGAGAGGGYYGQSQPIWLDAIHSRRVWDLLAEAQEIGLPLVTAGKKAGPVTVFDRPAHAELVIRPEAGGGLSVEPVVEADGRQISPGAMLTVGSPVHGLVWWHQVGEPEAIIAHPVLRMAPFTLPPALPTLLSTPAVAVPPAERERFLTDYVPLLRSRVQVRAADDSLTLPELGSPVLVMTLTRRGEHRVGVGWHWRYPSGGAGLEEPLWPVASSAAFRDVEAEQGVLSRVTAVVDDVLPEVFESGPVGRRLAADSDVAQMAAVRLLTEVVPQLRDLPDIEIEILADEPLPEYQHLADAPLVTFTDSGSGGGAGSGSGPAQDWFDLAVSVSVGSQEVAFQELFTALAQGETHLILPNGSWFSLEQPAFHRLSALIAEARAMQDSPAGTVRLSRFQAGLWHELEEIGVVAGQAAGWQERVRALRALADDEVEGDRPVPAELTATLRPYQVAGFTWLARLYDLGLGGILADDMGLGKTLQVLALLCHARRQDPDLPPFLVVAPTSVVGNWAAEAARFAPGLQVATITQTHARREHDLAEAVGSADLVVTSYTLFRLEFEEYQALNWAALVLDEAQFLKNHQTRGYQHARNLAAPFKLAVTGTPMENNLMELWAMLSIVAPGLFANPKRFTEYFRTPIEKEHDADRLGQLRRRIKPLMLRRTKDHVAADLPEKQEQVIELELAPKHRRVYDKYLQRERQKVLGLLDNMTKNRFEIFRSLTLLRQAALDVTLVDGRHTAVPSTKLDVMSEMVGDVVAEGHRILIFSQFTRFLTAARERLEKAGIDCCYLDGKTTDRPEVIRRFTEGTAPVFLISLKAGGFGLNLTAADYCLLLDPWWNPATEAQAVDRVHRIGQTRNVMVYRLVAKDTIEEKVMALKAAKAKIFDQVMNGGDFSSGVLSASDIRELLS